MNLESGHHCIAGPSPLTVTSPHKGMAADRSEQSTPGFWPFNPLYYILPSPDPAPTSAGMSHSSRTLSPGGRRIANPGRVSESAINDPSYHQRHTSYASPRSSGGVIPISTETFINIPPPSVGRPTARYDPPYSSRPRRSSLVDTTRASGTAVNQLPTRSRPNVIQQGDAPRPSSPGKSGDPRGVSHKKVYSIDDGAARLVADVNVPAAADRGHRRRDSGSDRSGRRLADLAKDRGRKVYHANGHYRPSQTTIDDEDAFSYTDPAGMYRDTEPRWREVRPRRGSLDRAGGNRERPVSLLDPATITDPRRSTRDVGPPPSTRGWDRINEGLGRTRSAREVSQSPSRGRGHSDLGSVTDPRDPYYAQGTTGPNDRQIAMPYPDRYEDYGYDDTRSPRRHERQSSISRAERADRSVERRGFGIRTDVRGVSRDPYGRGSDESFEQGKYRDSAYVEPQRHNTLPDYPYHEGRRADQERRDRERPQNEPRDRQYERDPREKDSRRRDDERSYGERDYDRSRDHGYDGDRDRDRDRARQLEPPSDHDRDRHHRKDGDRKDHSPRHSGENLTSPSLAQAATGGLAGVAAALGASNLLKKVTGDKSERDDRERDRDRDRERDRDRDRERDHDRDRREKRSPQPASDDNERGQDRDKPRDRDRGSNLETPVVPPEPPRSAPPAQQERSAARETGHEPDKPVGMPVPAMDPNEEYRRRMEQVQRELGSTAADQRNPDDEADRERRRREREQRQRGADGRGGSATDAATNDVNGHDASVSTRRNLDVDDRSQVTASSGGSSDSRRRQSILDRPMTNEPAEIIDNTLSEKRENRVRIVDPPTEEEEKKPKGILKKPTEKFPEDPNVIREGVAPLKDSTKKGIPPGARWTKIDRRLVNPEALEKQGERFEERLDCVIVLRVLTKEEIQKLADLTRDIRDQRYEDEHAERKASRRQDRHRDRHERDEYSDDSENEFKERAPRMLEAAPPSSSTGPPSDTDYVRDSRDRRRDRDRESDANYTMSGALGRRE